MAVPEETERVIEMMRVAFGVRCVVAKETMSVYVRLAREIDDVFPRPCRVEQKAPTKEHLCAG